MADKHDIMVSTKRRPFYYTMGGLVVVGTRTGYILIAYTFAKRFDCYRQEILEKKVFGKIE